MNGGAHDAAVFTAPPSRPAWRLTTRELVFLALVSALVVVARAVLRMPIRVPGHSGIFWMALLVVGRGLVRKPGAGTAMGLVTAVLAVMFIPNDSGILNSLKYLAPGVTLDILAPLLGERFDLAVRATLAGAVANLSKLTAGLILAKLLGLPAGFIAIGLGAATATHIFFGGVGGLIGAFLLRRLSKAAPRWLSAPTAGGA